MNSPDMHQSLSLEELGLLHLLERIERKTHSVDAILRHGLLNQGLILAGEPLQLSDEGKQMVAKLRAARDSFAAENFPDLALKSTNKVVGG